MDPFVSKIGDTCYLTVVMCVQHFDSFRGCKEI